MTARQAINLLNNGIMPCVLATTLQNLPNNSENLLKVTISPDVPSNLITSKYTYIDYINNYRNGMSLRGIGITSPTYVFKTLFNKYLYANDLDEEIYINSNNTR